MAINLAEKYQSKLAQEFALKSVVDGVACKDYTWANEKTINIYTAVTQALADYARTGANRYGTPNEVQDTVQSMPVRKDRSFSLTIDKGNYIQGSAAKGAAKVLRAEMDEQAIPEQDKYALAQWVNFAGKLEALANAPTKTTIVEKISDGMVHLSNKKVPNDNRVIYIGWSYMGMLRLASEYTGNDELGKKVMLTGQIGEFMGAAVVPVPDDYLKVNGNQCYFLIVRKDAVLNPHQINDTRTHTDPPGLNGTLIEGRFLYDAYVIGAKADGVYGAVVTAKIQATPTVTISSHSCTIASSGSDHIYYTTDGSDPRYSKTAQVYSSSFTTTAGTVVKAYADEAAMFNSAVGTATDA